MEVVVDAGGGSLKVFGHVCASVLLAATELFGKTECVSVAKFSIV